jgi:hypothetical protein
MLSNIDPQLNSELVQLPYDIRREIISYVVPRSVHFFQHEARLKTSYCIATIVEQDGEYEVGYGKRLERSNKFIQEKENVWGRRLVSSWGVHWECEEMNLGMRESGKTMLGLGRTCKK